MALDRPKQEVPSQIIGELMAMIRGQFFADCTDKEWGQQYHFLKREVVTWPAHWLNSRGVTLPPERYREIIASVLLEVKIHGNTGAVRFWPGYLKKCLQDHFSHQGEGYYEEGKHIRATAERAMMAFGRAQEAASGADPVARIAEVHQALRGHSRRRRAATAPAAKDSQLDLL